MAILYGFVARCLFGVIFRHKAKQGRRLCAVATHKHLPHQRTAQWFTMRAQNPLGMVGLLSLPLVMGITMWEIGSGQSDVHSGNSMNTCCVVNANMDSGEPCSQYCMTKTWIFLPSDSLLIARERCLELSNWISVFKMFAFTTQQVTQTTGRKTV